MYVLKQTNNHAGTSASDLAPSVADNPARNAGQSSTHGTGAFTPASAKSKSEAAAEVAATVATNKDDPLSTLYFRDGKRRIDFVLAYEKLDDRVLENRRATFEKNLLKERLELELENAAASRDGKTNFLKVHAPWEVLINYAEKLHLRMPIKKRGRRVPFPTLKVGEGDSPTLPDLKDLEDISTELEVEAKPTKLDTLWAKLWTPFPYDKKLIPDEKQFFTAEFVCQREPMYLMQYKETFFSQAIRSRIAWEVLMRAAYEYKESQRGYKNFP
ncbi:anoctamin-5-like [Dermacentor andersoni]|uniref:anoctamin-5-like n=1 Tax=Dermacentor andersoni TaxID=34620 RepID=UPI003B3B51E0